MSDYSATGPVLTERGRVMPLNGVLERNGFPPWMMALFAPVLGFMAFQLIAMPLVLIPVLYLQGISLDELPDVLVNMGEYAGTLLVTNSVAQVLGLLLPALLLASFHSSRVRAYLRIRETDAITLGLAALGLAAFYPVVQWLAMINQQVPLPPWLDQLEQGRYEFIETTLAHGFPTWFTLLAFAITPALCEEWFFRGYVQRQAERSMGVVWGIVFTGVIFGTFHLAPAQVLPLSALGVFLAYLTWRSGSIWPAVLVHFLNNGFAVVASEYTRAEPGVDLDDVDKIQVPWYILLPSLVAFAFIVHQMNRWSSRREDS